MIVVDANVISYLILKGPFSEDCGKLFLWDSEWAAPRLWRDEVSNVLVTYERRKMINRKDALLAFKDAEAIIGENEFDVQIERIMNVAHRTQCSAYDSQYVALAEDLNFQLFTYDKKVLTTNPNLAIKPGDQQDI